MGAWGAGGLFSSVNECTDYLEAPACTIAIAAAEVVAALRERPAEKVPEEVSEFVTRIGAPPSAQLVSSALRALERIRNKSELQELWDESESREEWHRAMAELVSRLK